MRSLLGVTLLAISPWLAISRAAAQATPAKLLEQVEDVLVERAAGVRDYSLVIRSEFGELTVYARREAGEWRFEHDAAEDDLAFEYVMMPLGFFLFADRGATITADEIDAARATLGVDTIRGRIANRLAFKFPPGFTQQGAGLVSIVSSFDTETSDLLRFVMTGHPAHSGLELERPWRSVFGAEMFDFRDDGGVRFPRRFRVWGSELVPPVPPAQLQPAIDAAVERLEQLRQLPPEGETARRIAQAELALELLRTGRMDFEAEIVDFRINAGPPPGLSRDPAEP